MAIKDEIRDLANWHAEALRKKIDERVEEMRQDDTSHFLIYRVLGISDEEGLLIDAYQNSGRFLYKYAGSFLEQSARLCFKTVFPDSGSIRIPNTQGSQPENFEIDCLVGNDAIEIKWRDATTDGDHVNKERARLITLHQAGYIPVRVMFYYPNRKQAIKIQKKLEAEYIKLGGLYYHGGAAWEYVRERTGINLKLILEELAAEKTG